MARYEIVDANGAVVNAVEWDGESPFDVSPHSLRLVPEPEPAPEPEEPQGPVIPSYVTPWQAREALRLAGLLPSVNTHIEGLGENHQVYIAWHYAERIARNSPLVASLAPTFNLTEQQLDDLFIVAGAQQL